jgi:hypothetical protein
MRIRHTRATPVWGMGVRIQDRVKLDSVLEAKARGGCLRNCLREVGERYILDQGVFELRVLQKCSQKLTK